VSKAKTSLHIKDENLSFSDATITNISGLHLLGMIAS
jgi:hypothetical protein